MKKITFKLFALILMAGSLIYLSFDQSVSANTSRDCEWEMYQCLHTTGFPIHNWSYCDALYSHCRLETNSPTPPSMRPSTNCDEARYIRDQCLSFDYPYSGWLDRWFSGTSGYVVFETYMDCRAASGMDNCE